MATNTTGNNNTTIGASSNVQNSNLSNGTAIGYQATVTASNAMRFGNGSVTFWGFGANPAANKALIVGATVANGNGAYLTVGGVWTNTSDRALKEDIQNIDKAEILKKIIELNISKWKYTGTENEYHIGPMAQDFYASLMWELTTNQYLR